MGTERKRANDQAESALPHFFPPYGCWRVAAFAAGIPFTVWVTLTMIENAGRSIENAVTAGVATPCPSAVQSSRQINRAPGSSLLAGAQASRRPRFSSGTGGSF